MRPITITTKKDLVARLRQFAATGWVQGAFHEGRGDRLIARGLADFFEHTAWLPEETHNAYVYYLDRWLVDAFVAFHDDDAFAELRVAWKREMGGHCDEIPDLINLGSSDPVWAALVGTGMARMLAAISGEPWLEEHISGYLGAQNNAVTQAFRHFVRKAWHTGLCTKLKDSTRSGHGGVFGKTKLLSFCTAGRIMFTFGDGVNGPSVSFVGEDGEAAGARFGLQSCRGSMVDAIGLIGDVIAHWSIDEFKEASDVFFG